MGVFVCRVVVFLPLFVYPSLFRLDWMVTLEESRVRSYAPLWCALTAPATVSRATRSSRFQTASVQCQPAAGAHGLSEDVHPPTPHRVLPPPPIIKTRRAGNYPITYLQTFDAGQARVERGSLLAQCARTPAGIQKGIKFGDASDQNNVSYAAVASRRRPARIH